MEAGTSERQSLKHNGVVSGAGTLPTGRSSSGPEAKSSPPVNECLEDSGEAVASSLFPRPGDTRLEGQLQRLGMAVQSYIAGVLPQAGEDPLADISYSHGPSAFRDFVARKGSRRRARVLDGVAGEFLQGCRESSREKRRYPEAYKRSLKMFLKKEYFSSGPPLLTRRWQFLNTKGGRIAQLRRRTPYRNGRYHFEAMPALLEKIAQFRPRLN